MTVAECAAAAHGSGAPVTPCGGGPLMADEFGASVRSAPMSGKERAMVVVAGYIVVAPERREEYLAGCVGGGRTGAEGARMPGFRDRARPGGTGPDQCVRAVGDPGGCRGIPRK